MFQRVSSNVLLQSFIVVLAAALTIVLSAGAWDAWRTLGTDSLLAKIADASGYGFRALHNLRLDRSLSVRALNVEGAIDPGQHKQISQARAAELPALRAMVAALRPIDFADHDAVLARLEKSADMLAALVKESEADFAKPKDQRRAALPKEYETVGTELINAIERVSELLTALAKFKDPFVDQMMAARDVAWVIRSDGGDTSLLVSNAIAFKQRMPEASVQKHAALTGRTEAGWSALEKVLSGATLPPALAEAVARAKSSYFAPEFLARRYQIVNSLAAGEALKMTTSDWTFDSVPRLARVTAVAEGALDAAKSHADARVVAAERNVVLKLAFLAIGMGFGVAGFWFVSRRVMRPLRVIQTAMLKVADGELAMEVPYADRGDEIGALAQALIKFKENAGEKTRIESEQQRRATQAAQRQQAIEGHIAAFESHVGEALQALSSASGDMRATSAKLTATAEQTNQQAKNAAGSSANASSNVQTVAAASQELTASIGEIGRQVTHAASIAGRAVTETQQTDTTVKGLTEATQRIGQIVSLISEIADQTNLLALNATIEAARAGDSGKGFAVVAAEVKSLANQTAKATDDISNQIAAIQGVAASAAEAMRRIGGTIDEVNSVAGSIAAAVEQQGAATQEISRNTQEAARCTVEVSASITGVTAGADATGAAAENVRTSSEALNQQAEKLRLEVDDFLAKIRAA
jgi:methyl-accepting chemotaxis protein